MAQQKKKLFATQNIKVPAGGKTHDVKYGDDLMKLEGISEKTLEMMVRMGQATETLAEPAKAKEPEPGPGPAK